jgi:protein TonB
MAKDTRVQGTVVVSAEVEPTGKVTAVTVESGPMLLRGAAIEAVKQWKYAPALVDGRPVAAHITVGVEFHLN